MDRLVPQSGRDTQRKLEDFRYVTPGRPWRPGCKSQREPPLPPGATCGASPSVTSPSAPGSPARQARPLREALEARVAALGSQGRGAGPARGEGSGAQEPQVSGAVQSPGREPDRAGGTVLTDERTQLVRQLPGARGQHLPPHVLEDHGPGLEVHHEHGHQLRLGPLQLRLRRNPPPHGSARGGSPTVARSRPRHEQDRSESRGLPAPPGSSEGTS